MRRVLVVDDNRELRLYLVKALRDYGYRAAEAETAPLALAKQLMFKPHIVLLDVVMPGVNGNEIIEKLLAFNPKVVVIMMTGYPNGGLAHLAIGMGARDYIVKPFNLDRLSLLINTYELLDLPEVE